MTKIIETHQTDVLDLSIKRQQQHTISDVHSKRHKSNTANGSYAVDDYKKKATISTSAYSYGSNENMMDDDLDNDETGAVHEPYECGSYQQDELDVDDDVDHDDYYVTTVDNQDQFHKNPVKRKKNYSTVANKSSEYSNNNSNGYYNDVHATSSPSATTNKKQMRFRCKFCPYKSHSVSLIQNHIYRHIDTTPYSCFYCGHKSTTKSTIMVHIELCHPNMEVKIDENRVKEEDYYVDLNQQQPTQHAAAAADMGTAEQSHQMFATKFHIDKYDSSNKFEIIASKCHFSSEQSISETLDECVADVGANMVANNIPLAKSTEQLSNLSSSTTSSCCVSPTSSQAQQQQQSDEQQIQNHIQNDENDNYLNVFNRPKQYFGSLYEPDKQYSCKLCTYTTNHKPSMEDHVYVHTNKRPYRCGYCNEEIYTRYAATYHNKYKHPGEPRYFIKDEQDVTKFYVNRAAKKECNDENANLTVQNPTKQAESPNKKQADAIKLKSHAQLKQQLNTNPLKFPIVPEESVSQQQQQYQPPQKSSSSNSHSKATVTTKTKSVSTAVPTVASLFSSLMATNAIAGLQPQPHSYLLNQHHQQQPMVPTTPMFDYNMQIKLYQMYLQNLMTANLMQNLRNVNTSSAISHQLDDSNNNSDQLNNSNSESFNDNDDSVNERNDDGLHHHNNKNNNTYHKKSQTQQARSTKRL